MNRRSLARAVVRASNLTWNDKSTAHGNGSVAIVAVFSPDSFPEDTPTWNPGPGFVPCVSDVSWIRYRDDEIDMVVAPVSPKLRPALDGGEWTEPEVWSVTVPKDTDMLGFLWDKPHRITGQTDNPAAVVRREPYVGHPSKAVFEYWDAFEEQHGFRPRESGTGSEILYGPGSRWVVLEYHPGWSDLPNEADLVHWASRMHEEFGAKLRIYPYDPARGRFPLPDGLRLHDSLDGLARYGR